jgi:hypothetical protein
MQIPFEVINWSAIEPTFHKGETGVATWRTVKHGDLRIRMVEYSADYKADHWCEKGHIILCLEGEMETELADGSKHKITAGTSYHVSDDLSSHRSTTETGVKLFIIDGGFLQ